MGESILRMEARGSIRDLFAYRGAEVVVSGPAGTGKSFGALHKVHAALLKYPGARALLTRKTLASLATGGVVTYERKVLDPRDGVKYFGGSAKEPPAYKYPNGSTAVLGGMNKASKIMSSEYDLIYVQEAVELSVSDWEALTTRLRNGVMPYQQLIGDCNPDAPLHWIKQREAAGSIHLLYASHKENPALWDREAQEWTEEGRRYLASLGRLTGVRRQRLLSGLWVAAEGLVYEEFDPALHLVYAESLPRGWQKWPRLWGVDFGFRNAFVWQEWGISPEGDLYRLREIYKTETLVEDLAAQILRVTGWRRAEGSGHVPLRNDHSPLPSAIICDHDAEDRATLERHLGLKTRPAIKAIRPGIQAVQARLRPAATGGGREASPRIYFVRDALVERDQALDAAKLPCSTEEEIGGYVWDMEAGGGKKEVPVKKGDHGMDASRYIVAHVDGVTKAGRRAVFA